MPSDYYQFAGISGATYGSFDFGGIKTGQGYYVGSYISFADLYGGDFSFNYNPESWNVRLTRGGPLTLNPVTRSYNIDLNSDSRKWWYVYMNGNASYGENANTKEISATLQIMVSPTLTIQIGPDAARGIYNTQWVRVFADPAAVSTFGNRYIFARLDQKTVAANIRADWILSPSLSLQVYMQPLIVSGKYSQFKTLQRPKSYDFLTYGERGSTIVNNLSQAGSIDSYTLDPDGTGPAVSQTINNSDFNYLSLRGSAVLRWEYLAGSTLYFVWTQNRQDTEPTGEFNFGHSFNNLFNLNADNIFLIKISYWL
jgi:hypothetical protein